jgi:hypothetical protein
MIVAVIPGLFFMTISSAEARLVTGTLHKYINQRCTWVRPWIPKEVTSDELMNYNAYDSGDTDRMEKNRRLRRVAFFSTILAMSILLAVGFGIWFFFGKGSLLQLVARSFFYTIVFCITELTFMSIVTRFPLLDSKAIDVALVNRLIDIGKGCKSTNAPLDVQLTIKKFAQAALQPNLPDLPIPQDSSSNPEKSPGI